MRIAMTATGETQIFLLKIALLLLFVPVVEATNVKWTAANENSNDPASTAPKSQKYWDEHNIQRPDYAKTDAEILLEGSEGRSVLLNLFLVLVVVGAIGYFIIWPRILHGPGQKLGSSAPFPFFKSGSSTRSSREDAARQARLSRFDSQTPQAKED